jgi:inosose dehydratase
MSAAPSRIRFGCQTYSWQMGGEAQRGRIDHIAQIAARAGFTGLEPEVIMLGAFAEADRLAAVLAETGLELAAIAFVADWREPRETDDERREADRAIELVGRFPGTRLGLVPMPGADRAELRDRQDNVIACVNAVAERAAAAGIHASMHPNSPLGSVFRTAEDYEVLLDGLDAEVIGYTPDVGHIAAGGMDPLETIRRYRDRVDHVHFKDIDADGRWAPTGEGRLDFAAVVSYLADTGFEGWIVCEDEADSTAADPDTATLRNGAYVREILVPLAGAAEAGS